MPFAVEAGQQLAVPAHHRGHLAQVGKRVPRPSRERVGEVAEQPGTAQAAASDHHPGAAGPLHHRQGVGGLPDVAVAEHRDVDGLDQPRDRRPVRLPGVGLLDGARVQRDRGAASLLREPSGVEPGEVVGVDPEPGLHRDRDAVRFGGTDGGAQDRTEPVPFPRQHSPAAAPGHLGHRAAEVEVDVADPELGAQDRRCPSHHVGVDPVELHRADRLAGVEAEHVEGLRVPLHHPAGGGHLTHVQARALLPAELPEGRVGDPRHRREHHRRVDGQVPEREHPREATRPQQPTSRCASQVRTLARGTRSWAIVSRSRMVTASSSRVSKSTVMQYGVPISSCRR